MSLVAVIYDYDDDVETQAVVRPKHREFLAAQPNLLLSGPTDNGGALLLFDAGDGGAAAIETLLDEDPFKAAGVIASRTVTTWDVVLGSLRESLGLA